MMSKKILFIVLTLICAFTFLPFLGETYFHTKGEPREAIVAYSMLDSGNWILPVNNGGDMAYKPPFFHWCIAVFSLITGAVTEYTSRLSSALALIAMVLTGFLFFAKRRGVQLAFLMGLITLTNFEVNRAGFACRVDMVLTAFIVMSLYSLYRWREKSCKGFPWLATLLMGCAMLTKGPIGIILPCLVIGVYRLVKRDKFLTVLRQMALVGIVSCILPALWYIAAYQEGGNDFITLVMEENFGRFMGKMSYESHENPAYYNVITVFAGFVPYTLLVLLSLFSLKYTKLSGKPREWWKRFVTYIRQMDDARLFSLLSIVIIFVFYCIPKSKRSVYLLPIYPFLAYFMAEYILYLIKKGSKAIKAYGSIMAGLGILLLLVFIAVKCGFIPETIFKGRHAGDNIDYLHALKDLSMNVFSWILVILPLAGGIYYFRMQSKNSLLTNMYVTIAVTFFIYWSLLGVYQPAVLNVKSDKAIAEQLCDYVPEGKIYSYVGIDMLRFFTINFYNKDRVALFEKELPQKGYLLVGENDIEKFNSYYGKDYKLDEVYRSSRRGCDIRSILYLFHFTKK